MNWLALVVIVWLAVPAWGNPSCGSTLPVGQTVLDGNLGCQSSPTHGLIVQSGSVLDCQGYVIKGPDGLQPDGAQTGHYGIYVLNASGAQVRNCKVKFYERGVRIRNSDNVVVSNTTSVSNTRYGYEITGMPSTWITVEGALIDRNGDEGMHLGGPFTATVGAGIWVTGSVIMNQVAEGLYLLSVNVPVQVRGNVLDGNGQAAIYVKHTQGFLIGANYLPGQEIHVVGNSTGGQVFDNVVGRIDEDPLDGFTPQGNVYMGNVIQ